MFITISKKILHRKVLKDVWPWSSLSSKNNQLHIHNLQISFHPVLLKGSLSNDFHEFCILLRDFCEWNLYHLFTPVDANHSSALTRRKCSVATYDLFSLNVTNQGMLGDKIFFCNTSVYQHNLSKWNISSKCAIINLITSPCPNRYKVETSTTRPSSLFIGLPSRKTSYLFFLLLWIQE